jgi:hypothetical protein
VASKRRLRRRACGEKRRYTTVEAARADLPALYRRMRTRGGTVPEHHFAVYRCQWCGAFHIGSNNKVPQWVVKRQSPA